MIQIQDIRDDFPEFADQTAFPDSTITFWLNVAGLLINQNLWGAPASFTQVSGTIANGGANYAVNDKLALSGGVYSCPVILLVTTVDGSGAITAFAVQKTGSYTVTPPNPVAASDTTGNGAGATFSMTWKSGPKTECDLAIELYTCHNLVLEGRAAKEAASGAIPGGAQGVVSSKSVGPVSVSYDVALSAVEGAGDLNLSIYGQRLARLIKMFGMGPLTIIGSLCGGPFANGGFLAGPGAAWQGPIYAQGINWDM